MKKCKDSGKKARFFTNKQMFFLISSNELNVNVQRITFEIFFSITFSISKDIKKFMDDNRAYFQAKKAFERNDFETSIQNLELIPKKNFEFNIIIEANMYIAKILSNKISFSMETADSIISKFNGVESKNRSKLITCFSQNLSLILFNQKKYDLAFHFIDVAQHYDSTTKSFDIFCSICLSVSPDQLPNPLTLSPLLLAWHQHLMNKNEILSKIEPSTSNDPHNSLDKFKYYLAARANLSLKRYEQAFPLFKQSAKLLYRTSESLNLAAICAFHLGNYRTALELFTSSLQFQSFIPSFCIFNAAEAAGALGHLNIQKTLLEHFSRMEYSLTGKPSLQGLYLLTRASLFNKDLHTSSKYEAIFQNAKENGSDLPSKDFMIEYAYSLCLERNFEKAESLIHNNSFFEQTLSQIGSKTPFEKKVRAWISFGNQKFDQVYKALIGLNDANSYINRALIFLLAGEINSAISEAEIARKLNPENKDIIRRSVLIHLCKEQTIKKGYAIWLSSLGISLNEKSEYYSILLKSLKSSIEPDPLTISALDFWNKHCTKKPNDVDVIFVD